MLPQAQYTLVQSARKALLAYCATLRPADLVAAPIPAFHHTSIRDLLVHVANVYQHWLGVLAQGHPPHPVESAAIPDVAAVAHLYKQVDTLVLAYCERSNGVWHQPHPVIVPGRAEPLLLTPLALFTHVLTHEFHHKGQMLSMSRVLGYTPVDTDVIRT